ncbi:SemiSWEET family transporter [Phyllobacterium sp. CCNWLW109]|uniref:SemiSWEET family sugar transporter n=1 Tax=Phyllobacterium sp. CCNWLW109 TaxID=3127479 RepID=UPI0030779878
MDTALIVGYLASLCSVCSFLPQVRKVIRTGDTEAISTKMYCLTVTGFILWTAYAVRVANHCHECCLLCAVGAYPCKEAQKLVRNRLLEPALPVLSRLSGTRAP